MQKTTLALILLTITTAATNAQTDPLQFNRDIRPILSDHCFACHGFDENTRKADLRLDMAESAYEEKDGVAAIVPGHPGKSELWHRVIATDKDDLMPPPELHKPLSSEKVQKLKRWIEEGAVYQAHWAFASANKPDVPNVKGATHPIDAFIQRRLMREGLRKSPLADKETLIRRATLDLTGLPPTLDEVDTFVQDTSPDAYEKLIDELMSRPTFGEHMARYWLDLARYGDTHGMHLDNERTMWPYRDWVVRAFNENLRFDEFTRWQLAGDLLPDPTVDQRIASGFNRCNVTTGEGGSIGAEWLYRYAVDRTSTMAEVWMGLTAGCATCHDHKFDPISTKEYYSLYAFFNSAADPAMDGNRKDTPPIMYIPRPEDTARLAVLDKKIEKIERRIAQTISKIDYTDPALTDPPPGTQHVETVWFEDHFPKGAKPEASGPALRLTTKDEAPVYSGTRSITRTANGVMGQDFYSGGPSFTVPRDGTFFVHVYLDPQHPPEAVMVQFHVNGWNRRVVWGAHEKINWGKKGTVERVVMGPIPETGKWVRLQFTAKQLNLTPSTKVTGFAFTQWSGTLHWDRFGVTHTVDTANDPAWSWTKWKEQNQGKPNKKLPRQINVIVKGNRAKNWSKEEYDQVYTHWLGNIYAGARDLIAPLESEKLPFEEQKEKISNDQPYTFVMADLPRPRKAFVMERGQYDKRGEEVYRNVPAFLPPLPEKPTDQDYNRLDLANWLVSPNHPLTSRVAVNRLWQQFFGVGLVKTSADFGSQGTPPSHPELLDWLAVQYVDDGWNTKKFIKRMMTSHAYQQASSISSTTLTHDPENRLLARGPRFRLDAEVLRDQALALSGLLVTTIGGPGVKPYQPPNIWEPLAFGGSNTRFYKQDSGAALYRRSLYTFFKRTAPPPFMSNFDAPNREQSCATRGRSNTPLQALQLMNDIQHVEAARNFAQRLIQASGTADDSERIRLSWRKMTSRPASDEEVQIIEHALKKFKARYANDSKAANELISFGESKPDKTIDPIELAAWTLTANLMFNLDEVVTKN